MKFIIFIHNESSVAGIPLTQAIYNEFNSMELQFIRSVDALKVKSIQTLRDSENIFVLFVDSIQRFENLIPLAPFFDGKCLLLIIPDESERSLSYAHKFYPRFFTDINNGYEALCEVLHKMVKKQQSRSWRLPKCI